MQSLIRRSDRPQSGDALRSVAEARCGGMTGLADAAGLNRESLYWTLSERGNPQLESLSSLLQACGLRLTVDVSELEARR